MLVRNISKRVKQEVPLSRKVYIVFSFLLFQLSVSAQLGNAKYHLINDTTNKYSSIEQILKLKELKNKVVYIDIWFTSCEFCLKEFKYMPSLKQKFENDPITYLYLCTRFTNTTDKENFRRWKEIIAKYQLEGIHVLMSDECYSDGFLKKYENKYIGNIHYACPQYLLVNRNGKIVNFNPNRPSSEELLYAEIQKVLDEK